MYKITAEGKTLVGCNGVKKDRPQIMEIVKGDHEYDMIRYLEEEGYAGP